MTTTTATQSRTARPEGTTRIVFDRETCGRCGGTGYYGPLSVNNGRCFSCNSGGKGDGTVLTRNGENARKALEEWADANLVVAASSLEPGDRIHHNGSTRIVAERTTTLGRGPVGGTMGVEGTDTFVQWRNLGSTLIVTKRTSVQVAAHAPIRRAWTTATLEEGAAAVLGRRKGWSWA